MIVHARLITAPRNARLVRQLRVRAPDSSHRFRIQCLVEEALRATTLPGEEVGRVYFFRRLELPSFNESAGPQDWIGRCGRHLVAAGRQALHAGDVGAGVAECVYFRDTYEPYRLLFVRLLADVASDEWFWAPATGVPGEPARDSRAERLLDVWRLQPAGWAPVASELMTTITGENVEDALRLLSVECARAWLADLGPAPHAASPAFGATTLRHSSREVLLRASKTFGPRDERVAWLAIIAVLDAVPSAPQDGGLALIATALLEALGSAMIGIRRDARSRRASALLPIEGGDEAGETRTEPASPMSPGLAFIGVAADEPALSQERDGRLPAVGPDGRPDDAAAPAEGQMSLERYGDCKTDFAGLWFLLAALRHVGIVDALTSSPQLAHTHFAFRILVRLARTAGVPDDDAILAPCLAEISGHCDDPVVLPRIVPPLRGPAATRAFTERLWTYAVRRWCRAHPRLSARTIVTRPGRVRWTPTALDVTLPMSAVDVRIRRFGLDLDPGYVPWFGHVVHFHYHHEVFHGDAH